MRFLIQIGDTKKNAENPLKCHFFAKFLCFNRTVVTSHAVNFYLFFGCFELPNFKFKWQRNAVVAFKILPIVFLTTEAHFVVVTGF